MQEAEAVYRRILEAQPDHADANHLLGMLHHQIGDNDGAARLISKAIEANPGVVDYHSNLGFVLRRMGRLQDARASLEKATQVDPQFAEAHNNLGAVYLDLGQFEGAIASHQKAIDLNPKYPEALNNLGNALYKVGRSNDAVDQFNKAISLNPNFVEALSNLGNTLQDLGRLDDAVASYQKALALNPEYHEALYNLGLALSGLGRMDESLAHYQKALAIKPDYHESMSSILVTMPLISTFSADDVFAEAKRTGTAFEAPFKAQLSRRHGNDPDPDRILRVGYLSPNFSGHVLAPYIEPILKGHRRDRVSVHVYAHVPRPDETTLRLKDLADTWTFVDSLSDDQVAEQIIEDGIDILVDPMGHWAANRLRVFARKPAPIQVSYLCQGMTTGLTAMDYAIGDRWLNEGGAMQAFATEQVVELDGGLQVTTYERETPIGPVPSEANGFITFCSFNNPAKISDLSLRLWAGVLNGVPESRLLIKGKWLSHPGKRELLIRRLEDYGIPAGRVDLRDYVPGPDHLAVHNDTDIALDTAPFTGGATTIDALWMGVPVVTLIGEAVYGRYSYGHLSRVGAPELAARGEDEFRDIAVTLAGDAERLRHYRQSLRPALQASSLFDADGHVAELEDAYRIMWRRWCEGLKPEGFGGA
ncbi:MAG: tetratricopeptide repeat protein [Proteobacteria bacterium]|nr:tetratricopeptide repeat protein [Pseudomonadota bacterium]